jgi:hypothetical protein
MSRTSRRRRIAALAGIAVAGALVVAPPVSADADLLRLTVAHLGQQSLFVDVCLNTTSTLPATVELTYTVSTGGSVTSTDAWDGGGPGTIIMEAPACPASLTQFATTDLAPGTSYTVQVAATLTPMVEDTNFELAPAPDTYPAYSAAIDLTVSTLPGDAADSGGGGGGGGDPGSGGGSASPPSGSGGGSTTAGAGGTTPGSTGSPAPTATPVIIRDPGTFSPSQLAGLSPRQVATIAPPAFGLLSPTVFAALTGPQAAELTPAQASAIRPARAARLTPGAVASLDAAAVAAMRPAAVASLSAAAVRAMSPAQLSALTPRQVAALRPDQLARLTVAQRALLRR